MYMKTDVNLHKNLTETHINVDGNTSLQGKAARFSLFSCTYGVNKPLKKQLYKTFQPPAPLQRTYSQNILGSQSPELSARGHRRWTLPEISGSAQAREDEFTATELYSGAQAAEKVSVACSFTEDLFI